MVSFVVSAASLLSVAFGVSCRSLLLLAVVDWHDRANNESRMVEINSFIRNAKRAYECWCVMMIV